MEIAQLANRPARASFDHCFRQTVLRIEIIRVAEGHLDDIKTKDRNFLPGYFTSEKVAASPSLTGLWPSTYSTFFAIKSLIYIRPKVFVGFHFRNRFSKPLSQAISNVSLRHEPA